MKFSLLSLHRLNRLRCSSAIVLLFIVFLISFLGSCQPKSGDAMLSKNATVGEGSEGRTIMAIFAHPDDESTVGPVLSRYVREGKEVHVVICTDGRLGTNDFSDLEAGDGLAEIRRKEMECAADHLGVNLIHLDYHDQLRAGEGYDGHMPHARSLILEIDSLIGKYEPDVLVTFGPDGGSNHMDHRLIGATVSAVYLNKDWGRPSSLYYVATPSQNIEDEESRRLRGVDERYISHEVTFSEVDFDNAVASLSCHKSQMRLDGLRERMERRFEKGKKIYFRRFDSVENKGEDIF